MVEIIERARAGRKKEYRDLVGILSAAPLYNNRMPYPETLEKKWVIGNGRVWPARVIDNGLYPYVVLPNAEVRIGALPRPQGKIHHPELVGNRDVIAAGMLRITDGQVAYISNESGHYCPGGDCVNYALMALRHFRVPLVDDVKLDTTWDCFGAGRLPNL